MCCDLKQDVTIFFVLEMVSAYMSAVYILVHFMLVFFMETNNLNPDQTAREQSYLGPHCLQFRLPKNIAEEGSRQQVRTDGLLSCQPRVTVTSCFVYKVIRDLELIVHLRINPICRIGIQK